MKNNFVTPQELNYIDYPINPKHLNEGIYFLLLATIEGVVGEVENASEENIDEIISEAANFLTNQMIEFAKMNMFNLYLDK